MNGSHLLITVIAGCRMLCMLLSIPYYPGEPYAVYDNKARTCIDSRSTAWARQQEQKNKGIVTL